MSNRCISIVGSINYDILIKQKRLPEEGETFLADEVVFAGGGKGANQAVQCAKLGLETYIVGKVGNDEFGNYLVAKMKEYGVGTKYIGRSDHITGMGIVNHLGNGMLYSTVYQGANLDVTCADVDAAEETLSKSGIVLMELEIPVDTVIYTVEMLSEKGIYLILNAAPARYLPDSALKKIDCLIVNESEASFYAEKQIYDIQSAIQNYKYIINRVKDIVIITLGKSGSVLCEKNGVKVFPANRNIVPVEATGAGDSYIGGFAYGKLNGFSNQEACIFAGKTAEITITGVGAQPAMPTLKQVTA